MLWKSESFRPQAKLLWMVEMCGSCFFFGEWVVDMYQRNLEVACIYIRQKTSFLHSCFPVFVEALVTSNTKLKDNESLNKALFLGKVGRHFLLLIWMFFFGVFWWTWRCVVSGYWCQVTWETMTIEINKSWPASDRKWFSSNFNTILYHIGNVLWNTWSINSGLAREISGGSILKGIIFNITNFFWVQAASESNVWDLMNGHRMKPLPKGSQLSNEKKPWLFRVYRGWNTTQLYRDY